MASEKVVGGLMEETTHVRGLDDERPLSWTEMGGKASQMAVLRRLARDAGPQGAAFLAPDGYVVTTHAYEELLRLNPPIAAKIRLLDSSREGREGREARRREVEAA